MCWWILRMFSPRLRRLRSLRRAWQRSGRSMARTKSSWPSSSKSAHDGVTAVPISRTGKNALDFHLSFYLGYVAAKHPTGRLTVIANDKGYDPMIVHAKALGFTTQRIGFKAKKAAAAKKEPVAKKAVPVKKKPVAKKVCARKESWPPARPRLPRRRRRPKRPFPPRSRRSPRRWSSQSPTQILHTAQFSTESRRGLAKMGDKCPEKLKSFLRASCIDVGQRHSAIRRAGGGQ